MYIATVPFKERFEIVKEVKRDSGFVRILKDKMRDDNNDYVIQTENDFYMNYNKIGVERTFNNLTREFTLDDFINGYLND